jgi:hypothetical protein
MDHARDHVDEVMRASSTASKNDWDTCGKCRAGSLDFLDLTQHNDHGVDK